MCLGNWVWANWEVQVCWDAPGPARPPFVSLHGGCFSWQMSGSVVHYLCSYGDVTQHCWSPSQAGELRCTVLQDTHMARQLPVDLLYRTYSNNEPVTREPVLGMPSVDSVGARSVAHSSMFVCGLCLLRCVTAGEDCVYRVVLNASTTWNPFRDEFLGFYSLEERACCFARACSQFCVHHPTLFKHHTWLCSSCEKWFPIQFVQTWWTSVNVANNSLV